MTAGRLLPPDPPLPRPDVPDPSEPETFDDMVVGEVPDWGPEYLADLVATLSSGSAPFPCTFAVTAARRRSLRFSFVDSVDDPAAWDRLRADLLTYLGEYRSLTRDTSFVALFRPESRTRGLEEYRERFWAVLQYLHAADDRPWPADVPTDPDDPLWEFCFAGTPIFVVCNTPAHTTRLSRHGQNFLITFQPRWVFEGIEPHTRRGRAARKVIRRRLEEFDGMAPSTHLGDYGDPGNREYRQYFLPDVGDPDPPRCPFDAR